MEIAEGHQEREFSFWVSSAPFFESAIFLVPRRETAAVSCRLEVYDSDGVCVNRGQVAFSNPGVQIVELEPFLGGCKLESGLRHAHVVATPSPETFCHLRLHTRESSAWVGEPTTVSAVQGGFFPLTLSSEHSNILCLVNRSGVESALKARCFLGKRSPESTWIVPPKASRVICLESEFRSFMPSGDEGAGLAQAYLRITTKSGEVGVQLLERTAGPKDGGFFASIS